MGRVPSAHLDKSTSFLISAMDMRRAAMEVNHSMDMDEINTHLMQWIKARREQLDIA